MQTVDLIRAVRDKVPVPPHELRRFIARIAEGAVPEYQISAFLMAAYLCGLGPALLAPLTESIRDSGSVLSWDAEIRPLVIDKHSTGGVGDKVSLVLAPLAAACGLKVPMVSGRGLGHTGGTLDKLASIPGFSTDLSLAELQSQVHGDLGVAIAGQSESMAPVDRVLYALRDATATVESSELVASSIMSKKLAEGLSGLVIDLKVGSGAFMKTRAEAEVLEQAIAGIAAGAGLRTTVLLTRMDEPLGEWIGNRAEVAEALDVLQSRETAHTSDLRELVVEQAVEMVCLGLGEPEHNARDLVLEKLGNGEALAKFWDLVRAQGGTDSFAGYSKYTALPVKWTGTAGYVSGVDAEELGRACMQLGGGRATAEDVIDADVALQVCFKIGEYVTPNATLANVYAPEVSATAFDRIRAAFTVSSKPPRRTPLILANTRKPSIA